MGVFQHSETTNCCSRASSMNRQSVYPAQHVAASKQGQSDGHADQVNGIAVIGTEY